MKKQTYPLGMGKALVKKYDVLFEKLKAHGCVTEYTAEMHGFRVLWTQDGKQKARRILEDRDVAGLNTSARLGMLFLLMLREDKDWAEQHLERILGVPLPSRRVP